jgi:hypothetical protein
LRLVLVFGLGFVFGVAWIFGVCDLTFPALDSEPCVGILMLLFVE